MIFKLRTSDQTEKILKDLESRTYFKPFILVKHAIVWSIKENTSVKNYKSNSKGLELNRQTITGNHDAYFKALIEQIEGRHLPEEEYFPHYLKSHIDRGAEILRDMYNHAGNIDNYVKHSLGIGDTV